MNCPHCGNTHSPTHHCAGYAPAKLRVASEQKRWRKHFPIAPVLMDTMPDEILAPTLLLQGKRYLLETQVEIQRWRATLYEARWLARDMADGATLSISEVMLPLPIALFKQFLNTATRALLVSGEHAHTTALLDVFMEAGRGFFVFRHHTGESLQVHVERGMLSSDELRICYLQIAHALQFLEQQHIVYGAIEAAHIIRVNARWILAPGSVLFAGDAARFLAEASEPIPHEITCVPSDIHILAVLMYHAATGNAPSFNDYRQHTQLAQAGVPAPLAAVLAKGVHSLVQERYQQPGEIIQALTGGREQQEKDQGGEHVRSMHQDHSGKQVRPVPQVNVHEDPHQQHAGTVPPKMLPASSQVFDTLSGLIWTGSILLGCIVLLLIARA
jgi:hypothetical protein